MVKTLKNVKNSKVQNQYIPKCFGKRVSKLKSLQLTTILSGLSGSKYNK